MNSKLIWNYLFGLLIVITVVITVVTFRSANIIQKAENCHKQSLLIFAVDFKFKTMSKVSSTEMNLPTCETPKLINEPNAYIVFSDTLNRELYRGKTFIEIMDNSQSSSGIPPVNVSVLSHQTPLELGKKAKKVKLLAISDNQVIAEGRVN